MIKYIGFDKDGTIIDDIPDYISIWGEIVSRDFGINSSSASDVFSQMIGEPTALQLKKTLEEKDIHLSSEELFQKSSKIAEEIGAKAKGDLFPDALDTLIGLKRKGYKAFISSGQQEKVITSDLSRTGIVKYIDIAIGIHYDKPDFKKGKPHFKAASEFFGIPFQDFVKETIFVGDTPEDIKVANESNIISVCRMGTFSKEKLLEAGAKFVVKDLTELFDILQKLNN